MTAYSILQHKRLLRHCFAWAVDTYQVRVIPQLSCSWCSWHLKWRVSSYPGQSSLYWPLLTSKYNYLLLHQHTDTLCIAICRMLTSSCWTRSNKSLSDSPQMNDEDAARHIVIASTRLLAIYADLTEIRSPKYDESGFFYSILKLHATYIIRSAYITICK